MTHSSHRLWKADDIDLPESLREVVQNYGIAVCRVCWEYEAGLEKSCRQAWLERRRDEIIDELMLLLPCEPAFIQLKAELVVVNCDLALLKNKEKEDAEGLDDDLLA